MPARPWPDGMLAWRRGLASRLRGMAERLEPGGPATRGPSPAAPSGTGGPTARSTPSRGFDLSGAPEHWVRLLRDAGLAPAGDGSAADAPIVDVPAVDAPTVDAPTVRGHFGLSRLRKFRLRPATARMPFASSEPKGPTTAGLRLDAATQATEPPSAAFDSSDPVTPPQRGDNAVPTLRLRPERVGSTQSAPVRTTPPQPTPALMTHAQPTHAEPTHIQQPTPGTPAPTDQTTEPRDAPHVVRPALRLLARSKNVEQASQSGNRGIAPGPQLTAPQEATPQQAAPAAPMPPGPVNPQAPNQVPAKPDHGRPTPPAAVVLPHTPESHAPKPEPSPPHASTPQHPAPKAPLTGTWPKLAPKPSPQTTTQSSSEHLEHALARAARLNHERSAV